MLSITPYSPAPLSNQANRPSHNTIISPAQSTTNPYTTGTPSSSTRSIDLPIPTQLPIPTVSTTWDGLKQDAHISTFDQPITQKEYVEHYAENIQRKMHTLNSDHHTVNPTSAPPINHIITSDPALQAQLNTLSWAARINENGTISHFEKTSETGAVLASRPATSQEATLQENTLLFLERLDIFHHPLALKDIGVLSNAALKEITDAPEYMQPFLLDALNMKRDVSLLLTIDPDLCEKFLAIANIQDYLVDKAPFDTSIQRNTLLSTIQHDDSFDLSEKTVRENQFLRQAEARLSQATIEYQQALYHPQSDGPSLWDQANSVKKHPQDVARHDLETIRQTFIGQIKTIVTTHLHAVAHLAQDAQANKTRISEGMPAYAINEKIDHYLSKLDKKIATYSSGERNALQQKKVKYEEILKYISSSLFLPEESGFLDGFDIHREIYLKLSARIQNAQESAKNWAIGAARTAALEGEDALDLLSAEDTAAQLRIIGRAKEIIQDEFEKATQEALAELNKRHRSASPNIFQSAYRIYRYAEDLNIQYDYEVALARYRSAMAGAHHHNQSRTNEGDSYNPVLEILTAGVGHHLERQIRNRPQSSFTHQGESAPHQSARANMEPNHTPAPPSARAQLCDLLNLQTTASNRMLTVAYKAAAMRLHPDKTGNTSGPGYDRYQQMTNLRGQIKL